LSNRYHTVSHKLKYKITMFHGEKHANSIYQINSRTMSVNFASFFRCMITRKTCIFLLRWSRRHITSTSSASSGGREPSRQRQTLDGDMQTQQPTASWSCLRPGGLTRLQHNNARGMGRPCVLEFEYKRSGRQKWLTRSTGSRHVFSCLLV
jgi:hypothetical protein